MSLWEDIAARISAANRKPFVPGAPATVAGGCINQTFRLGDGRSTYFVKTHRAALADMFAAEAEALQALADCGGITVPQPVCHGVSGQHSFLVMTYLNLAGNGDWGRAGQQLAQQHRCVSDRFGWHRDNTIGSTPQHNSWQADWTAFWRDQRLGFQLSEAARNGYRGRIQALGEQLLERFPSLFDHSPRPSLLHGDLWAGNIGFVDTGAPVVFDPATYYGDREAEIAMTELFGGFDARFYAAYNSAWPLDPGYRTRRSLYNLYHVLNHANLFGGGYAGQAERMMASLLAEC